MGQQRFDVPRLSCRDYSSNKSRCVAATEDADHLVPISAAYDIGISQVQQVEDLNFENFVTSIGPNCTDIPNPGMIIKSTLRFSSNNRAPLIFVLSFVPSRLEHANRVERRRRESLVRKQIEEEHLLGGDGAG